MSQITESIDVHVPVTTAYNQWTQFEEFPRFMEGVERVEQISDTRMHWVAQIAGQHREWDAQVTEQVPDQRVAWTSVDGARNAGVVTFHHLAPDTTRVTLQLDFEPEGPMETVGAAMGVVKLRVKGDLERFRDFIERRGSETGAWRGEVDQGRARGASGGTGAGTGLGDSRLGDSGLGAGSAYGEGIDDGLGGGLVGDDYLDRPRRPEDR